MESLRVCLYSLALEFFLYYESQHKSICLTSCRPLLPSDHNWKNFCFGGLMRFDWDNIVTRSRNSSLDILKVLFFPSQVPYGDVYTSKILVYRQQDICQREEVRHEVCFILYVTYSEVILIAIENQSILLVQAYFNLSCSYVTEVRSRSNNTVHLFLWENKVYCMTYT